MHIKKGDTVIVIAGNDKGKKGKVLKIDNKKQTVIIENVRMVTKHQKPSMQVQQGGIIHMEAPIHVSNVQLYDPKTQSGTRVGYEERDGRKVRVSKKSGEVID